MDRRDSDWSFTIAMSYHPSVDNQSVRQAAGHDVMDLYMAKKEVASETLREPTPSRIAALRFDEI